MFNEPLILSLCGVVRKRLLPCRVVVGLMDCIVYTDYVYSAFVSLLADISCLLFLFKKCCFFSLSFPPCGSFFFSLVYWPFRNRLRNVFFLHLMFAGRPPFAFLRWFQLFCLFHLVSAVCLPDYGSHITFAINICGLVFLSLP